MQEPQLVPQRRRDCSWSMRAASSPAQPASSATISGSLTLKQVQTCLPRECQRDRGFRAGRQQQPAVGLGRAAPPAAACLQPGFGAGVAGQQEALEPACPRRRAPGGRRAAGPGGRRHSAAPAGRRARARLRSAPASRRPGLRRRPRGTARRCARGRTARRWRRERRPSGAAACRGARRASSSGSQAIASSDQRQLGLQDLHRRVLELGLLGLRADRPRW